MLIIDSLLQFKFFLSGEVQENLSLFCSVKRKRGGRALKRELHGLMQEAIAHRACFA
jgi:hypothetical protein